MNKNINLLLNEAIKYFHNGKLDLAKNNLNKILSQDNKNFDALHIMGVIFGCENDHKQALKLFKYAESINSNNSYLHFNIAKALDKLGNISNALEYYKNAVNLDPNNADAWINYGEILQKQGKFENAMNCYERSIQNNPNSHLAWSNKGALLEKLGQYKDSIFCYDQAIKLNPQFEEGWSNKGITFQRLKKNKEAMECYDKAIQINPNYHDAYFNKSISKFIAEDFNEGWKLYEYRWKIKNKKEQYRYKDIPELTSLSNIKNKNILVWYEQGFGDTIQFSRYIPLLIEKKAIIKFEVQDPLYLFFKKQLSCEVFSKHNVIKEKFDYQIPLMSLPRLFKTKVNTIPKINLKADKKKINLWKQKLKILNSNLNIGIAISGNITYERAVLKSINLNLLEPIIKKYNVFIIQKDLDEVSKNYIKKNQNIIFLGDKIEDFTDTAAMVENMDIIISIDTSLIHLAGSLNKTSYLMLPWSSEWRWFYERIDSPWYSSVKIFRQKSMGDWNSVINEIDLELAKIKKN